MIMIIMETKMLIAHPNSDELGKLVNQFNGKGFLSSLDSKIMKGFIQIGKNPFHDSRFLYILAEGMINRREDLESLSHPLIDLDVFREVVKKIEEEND